MLLLCAGSGDRWGDHLGVPKQLVRFNKEPLLCRTVRLLAELNVVAHTYCVRRDERLDVCDVSGFEPSSAEFLVNTLLSTRHLWDRETIVLLGDVFYTRRAMRKIVASKEPVAFFGRPGPSALARCDHGELFGLRFSADGACLVEQAARVVSSSAGDKLWGNLWDLYHTLVGIPCGSGGTESRFFVTIDDLTNDFDTPSDYEKAATRYHWACSGCWYRKLLVGAMLLFVFPYHCLRLLLRTTRERKTPAEYYAARGMLRGGDGVD